MMEYLTADNIRAALLGGVAIVVTVGAITGLITGWVRKAKINELKSILERLRELSIRQEGTINNLNSTIYNRDAKIRDLESQVNDLEEELKAGHAAYRAVTISDAANQQRAEERQRQIEKLEAKIKAGEVMIHANYASIEARILALMNSGGYRAGFQGSPTGRLPNDGERYTESHRRHPK
jgi:peptidoglycan hydrolase CwlO-like protein